MWYFLRIVVPSAQDYFSVLFFISDVIILNPYNPNLNHNHNPNPNK